eukprot:6320299-Prymnesium_polylepis.1
MYSPWVAFCAGTLFPPGGVLAASAAPPSLPVGRTRPDCSARAPGKGGRLEMQRSSVRFPRPCS